MSIIQPKIYDFFPFRNEISMLNARLHELNSVVHKFIIIESTKTFSDQPKKLVYQQNQHLFKKFHDQIIYIVLDNLPSKPIYTDIDREKFQKREGFLRGLNQISHELNADDLILSSDLDEIPRINILQQLIKQPNLLTKYGPIGFLNRFFYYNFQTEILNRPWVGTIVMKASHLSKYDDMGELRDRRGSLPTIPNAGWHCSFFFEPNEIIAKMLACPDRKNIYHTRDWDPKEIQHKIDNSLDLIDRDSNDFKIKRHNSPLTDLPKYHYLMFTPAELILGSSFSVE